MAVSDRASSLRVPLSVTSEVAISAIISSMLFAILSTAPVQVISPMVLNRTGLVEITSLG